MPTVTGATKETNECMFHVVSMAMTIAPISWSEDLNLSPTMLIASRVTQKDMRPQ